MFAVYFCVESNYCTKYFMGGFALQYKYANECKSRAQKNSFYHGGEPAHFSSPSLSLNAEELRSFLHKAGQHLESALP